MKKINKKALKMNWSFSEFFFFFCHFQSFFFPEKNSKTSKVNQQSVCIKSLNI